ncbi:DUF805 domain-containing protein [Flavobacterium kingsejongi]|uniref:DUF805 domain-containing protein n=1 Tax=Flavobacterium kingsejongi TaxID=1678728 RepID=A0A2S1LM35_9FLAO|nr:DUF805 domain-containing protein [Flavobacterium kingsejongi]AWG24779.1 DUF805 domain-containing protein [Flavobacterium kingsejongi]
MIEWYKKVVLENYANFNGRARRAEYWNFVLVNLIISILLMVVDSVIGIQVLSGIYSLALLIPSIAAAVRRLHDLDKSGWFLLLAFIPLVNIWLIVLLASEGTRGPNQYGADPKNQFDEINHIGKEY